MRLADRIDVGGKEIPHLLRPYTKSRKGEAYEEKRGKCDDFTTAWKPDNPLLKNISR